MPYIYYNSNPHGNHVIDCTVRAISLFTDKTWDETYLGICMQGFYDKNMPSADAVWGAYLEHLGYKPHFVPNKCPNCITVKQFAEDHHEGRYLLAVGQHVVTVIDGNYYDTFDSGIERPLYYYTKQEETDEL